MHEMSLAEAVLQQVEDTARREAATRVRRVILAIGRLAAVEPDALRFCFASVSRGTLAAGALLEIEEIAGAGWCQQCAATVPMVERYAACPLCGAFQLQATAGTEMRVREIDIE